MQPCATATSSSELMKKTEDALLTFLSEIFGAMFNQQVRIVPHAEILDTLRLSAIVGFTGRFAGLLCIHLGSAMACSVASGLLGTNVTQVDGDVCDAIGELSNMVAGGAEEAAQQHRLRPAGGAPGPQ